LIKQVDCVPEKFLKHLTGTEGLPYEIRIIRIFEMGLNKRIGFTFL